MEKKSFVMYADYEKHIARLSDEDAGELFKAIFTYVNTGEEVPLSPAADMAFSFMKERIDRDSEKWAVTCQKRSEAGKKGGAPKGNKNAANKQKQAKQANVSANKQKQAKQANVSANKQKQRRTSKRKQTQAKQADNDNDNDILSLSKDNDMNIPQDSTALERAALPAPEEEEVIPWDEIDFELV